MAASRWVLLVVALVSMSFGAGWVASSQERLTQTVVDDIPWAELPDGRATAFVHGDMQTGEHLSYISFPAGMKTAPHTHSTTYVGIVVKGRARHFEPEVASTQGVLPPGSHYRVPGGVVHSSECLDGSECIFAIHQHDAFDRALSSSRR